MAHFDIDKAKASIAAVGSGIFSVVSAMSEGMAALDQLSRELYMAGFPRKLDYTDSEDREMLVAIDRVIRNRTEV